MKEYRFTFDTGYKTHNCIIMIDNRYHNEPDSVAILNLDNKKYLVYINDERGFLRMQRVFPNIDEAIDKAERWSKGLILMYEEPTVTLTSKGFNNERI